MPRQLSLLLSSRTGSTSVRLGSASVAALGLAFLTSCGLITDAGTEVADVTIAEAPGRLGVGERIQLAVTVTDEQGTVREGYPVRWSSSDTAMAVVTPEGEVRGVRATGGLVEIRAQAGGKRSEVYFEVIAPTVVLSPDSLRLVVDGAAALHASIYEPSRGFMTGETVDFTVTDSTVATLRDCGHTCTGSTRGHQVSVRAHRVGTAYVIARFKGGSDTALVRVLPAP
jgi:hypothetical protein